MGKNHKHRWLDKIVPGWELREPNASRVWLKVCLSCGEGKVVKVEYEWAGARK